MTALLLLLLLERGAVAGAESSRCRKLAKGVLATALLPLLLPLLLLLALPLHCSPSSSSSSDAESESRRARFPPTVALEEVEKEDKEDPGATLLSQPPP